MVICCICHGRLLAVRLVNLRKKAFFVHAIGPHFPNLFRAVAHFKEPQIFVAQFNKNYNEMLTISLEEA